MPKKEPYQNGIELLQGTLDMLILQTLVWGPQHGHGIGKAIRASSGDLLRVERYVFLVLYFWQMSHTITIRLTDELVAWLTETARRTGVPAGRLIRQQLEKAKAEAGQQSFLRHAGEISGDPDLSSRKGFSRR